MGTVQRTISASRCASAGVGLRARRRVPLPVPGHLHRVDREHHIAGSEQRLHPRTPFGLDPDQHLIWLTRRVQILRDQLMQRGDPGQTLRQPPPR